MGIKLIAGCPDSVDQDIPIHIWTEDTPDGQVRLMATDSRVELEDTPWTIGYFKKNSEGKIFLQLTDNVGSDPSWLSEGTRKLVVVRG